jgi:hypothetical protein
MRRINWVWYWNLLPAGLDILGRPKGENRIAHGLQPWEDGPRE